MDEGMCDKQTDIENGCTGIKKIINIQCRHGHKRGHEHAH